jgi:succinoglycan biosynthesis protein ExoA
MIELAELLVGDDPSVRGPVSRLADRDRVPIRERSGRVSVIVPMPPDQASSRAVDAVLGGRLDSGRTCDSARSSRESEALLDLVVARGRAPSRQRNVAVREARGEYLLFLDDDSVPADGLAARYTAILDRCPGVVAVGGPALPLAPRTPFERLAGAVLASPWVMGRSAARYGAIGRLRETDERELILCNLCVRRSAFEAVGGFDEQLYPNEENALLEKLRTSGNSLLYDPDARVERTHRTTLRSHLRAVRGYGGGRAAQLRRSASLTSWLRLVHVFQAVLLPSLLALAGYRFLGAPGCLLGLAPVFLFGLVSSISFARREGLLREERLAFGIQAAVLGLFSLSAYALGFVAGLLRRQRGESRAPVEIEVFSLLPGSRPLDERAVSKELRSEGSRNRSQRRSRMGVSSPRYVTLSRYESWRFCPDSGTVSRVDPEPTHDVR